MLQGKKTTKRKMNKNSSFDQVPIKLKERRKKFLQFIGDALFVPRNSFYAWREKFLLHLSIIL